MSNEKPQPTPPNDEQLKALQRVAAILKIERKIDKRLQKIPETQGPQAGGLIMEDEPLWIGDNEHKPPSGTDFFGY